MNIWNKPGLSNNILPQHANLLLIEPALVLSLEAHYLWCRTPCQLCWVSVGRLIFKREEIKGSTLRDTVTSKHLQLSSLSRRNVTGSIIYAWNSHGHQYTRKRKDLGFRKKWKFHETPVDHELVMNIRSPVLISWKEYQGPRTMGVCSRSLGS